MWSIVKWLTSRDVKYLEKFSVKAKGIVLNNVPKGHKWLKAKRNGISSNNIFRVQQRYHIDRNTWPWMFTREGRLKSFNAVFLLGQRKHKNETKERRKESRWRKNGSVKKW